MMDIGWLVIAVVVTGLVNTFLVFGIFRFLDRNKARCPHCRGRGSGPHAFHDGQPLFVCRSCRKVFEKTAAPA